MRRIADLDLGEAKTDAKTDAKDAAVIADAARTVPHTLRSLELTHHEAETGSSSAPCSSPPSPA
ncbi:hypothetical protein RKD29_000016 [Streptomyces tendae]